MTVTADEKTAARKYLVHDHAATTLRGQAGEEANRHAEEIDDRHPRARDIALTGTARELGKLPPHLARHQRQARHLAGISTEQAARIRDEYRAPERDDPEPREPRRSSSRSGARSGVVSYGSDLVGAAGDTSWGGTITQMFAWGMGLSLFYLVLTRVAAVSKLAQGATNVVRTVVSPVIDPLNPGGVTPRPIAPTH
ncbi:MAG TPA: hypothetical protein VG371_17445 [Solirubrobacteraceae bacterium]|jgi:hypothetical protein|nr:hypothetical protein [Solirubrobacteraceae bacterium]